MNTIPFSLRSVSLVLLVVAIALSGYLTYEKFSDSNAPCIDNGTFDCGTVLNSAYSEIGGIPIALLGLITNLIMLGLLVLETRGQFFQQNGLALLFGVNLFAFLFSVYLVYLQAMVIKAYCIWCLSHELVITLLFIATFIRFWKNLQNA